ncbi:hypothetical protein Vafri_19759 [Volvox africanus]|uniref:RNA-binding S4 domain-containing protein n=1 Tax=Volvox africanus TaxID=51714 RepID=A0A8J4BVM5_9CHLO|nr:hypothetical protein Vafri_19759 [Volvox africanus]
MLGCCIMMGSTLRLLAGRQRLVAGNLATTPVAILHPRCYQLHNNKNRRTCIEILAVKGDRPSTSGRSVAAESRPRLAKVLAACGVASRRACEELIAEGRVRVNGRVVSEQGTTIDPSVDQVDVLQQSTSTLSTASGPPVGSGSRITVTGTEKQQQQQGGGGKGSSTSVGWRRIRVSFFQEAGSLYYFAVNKPKGYICSSADVNGRKLAVELLSPWLAQWRRSNTDKNRQPPRFFTVGRLDVASSGLLFITNDGQWANRVIHPSSGVTKEYVVGLDKDASRPQLRALAAGTEVAGTFVSPLEVEVLGDPRRLRVVVAEGKKHEVRELVKAAGLELVSLKRVRIGGFRLPRDLGVGGYRELKPSEIRAITDLAVQEAASASGETRQAIQRQAEAQRAAAAAASVPRALRGMGEDVLERLRKARE